MGYAAQTQRNMYIKSALQMVKTIQARNFNYPALNSRLDTETLDALRETSAATSAIGIQPTRDVLSKYRTGASSHHHITDIATGVDTARTFSSTGMVQIDRGGRGLENLFEALELSTRYKRLSETTVFIQLVQELRRAGQ